MCYFALCFLRRNKSTRKRKSGQRLSAPRTSPAYVLSRIYSNSITRITIVSQAQLLTWHGLIGALRSPSILLLWITVDVNAWYETLCCVTKAIADSLNADDRTSSSTRVSFDDKKKRENFPFLFEHLGPCIKANRDHK